VPNAAGLPAGSDAQPLLAFVHLGSSGGPPTGGPRGKAVSKGGPKAWAVARCILDFNP
jgi:hypothetical protein